MFEFIYWVKALAALFITNSHYSNVWPISSMAFGGQLGNNLFFFISGFCLCQIREHFLCWYLKRIIRIYPAVWITTALYSFVGYFYIKHFDLFFYYYIYPTGFHFIGSIIVLYIAFYIVKTTQRKLNIATEWVMAAVFVIFISLYIMFFDKTSYHIDSVAEKWVMFMFSESLLAGSLLREKYERVAGSINIGDCIRLVSLFLLYFVGKKVFSNISAAFPVQFLQPIIVFSLAVSICLFFVKLEKNGVLGRCKKCYIDGIHLISAMTLEIYLGQDLIVTIFRYVSFPLSFVLVSASIFLYALLLHTCARFISSHCRKWLHL